MVINLPDTDVLALPWVLAEPAVMASPVAMLQSETIRAIDEIPELTEPERKMRNWTAAGLVVTFVWCVVAAVLMMTGVIFPIVGNVLAYLVMMAGLFCWAFLALVCPRTEEPETFWPLSPPCTPSRHPLTGRGGRE